MNKPSGPMFSTRQTITLELPLSKLCRILNPEQVMLKIAGRCHDIGALCYALRSDQTRGKLQPREVVTSSLIKRRPKQILQAIKALSNLIADGGKSEGTTGVYARHIRNFVDWSDANGLHDCLAGREATRFAFHGWETDTHERYRRQQFGEAHHNARLTFVSALLEATTGLDNLMRGVQTKMRRANPNGGTEPLALHDFAHAVALNQCLFDGLSDLLIRPDEI